MPLAIVVEDEWAIRMQIADAFLDAGWEVLEFASGELAVEFLQKARKVDFLITDIRLGGTVTGWDVAEAFRLADPTVKVMYASGNPQTPGRQVERSEFVAKPCRMDLILRAARA